MSIDQQSQGNERGPAREGRKKQEVILEVTKEVVRRTGQGLEAKASKTLTRRDRSSPCPLESV